eukprot:2158010-Pyramimonas_sp.AAC.1
MFTSVYLPRSYCKRPSPRRGPPWMTRRRGPEGLAPPLDGSFCLTASMCSRSVAPMSPRWGPSARASAG